MKIPGPEPDTFQADGVKVTVTFLGSHARLDIETTYGMEEAIRWELMRILKEFALRSGTRPQIGRQGGFCTQIDPSRARQAARQIIRRARRDQLFALHEEIQLPKPYIR